MKLFLVRSCSLIALLACSSMVAAAQTAAKPPSQAQWEAAFRARELRAAKLRDEVNAVDARIEGRIDALLEALRAISDSKDSRTKVARMKRDTIDQLQKTIEYYQRKRAAMLAELRRPTWNLSEEQKRAVIARFDERIEKRVAQIWPSVSPPDSPVSPLIAPSRINLSANRLSSIPVDIAFSGCVSFPFLILYQKFWM